MPLCVVCYIRCIIIASSTSSGNIRVAFLLMRREWLGWPEARDQVHPRKSYIFLHKNSVTFENIEWRPLFPPDRLKADEVMWRCGLPRLSDEATQNLRSRREWRGCLIVDVKMATGRFRDGVVVSGSAASPAGQTRDVRLRQVFLHAPSGGKAVKLASSEVADHSTTRY